LVGFSSATAAFTSEVNKSIRRSGRGTGTTERNHMYLAYIRARLAREEGQALVEYALIISLIAVAAIAALTFLSGGIQGIFTSIGNAL
jgi:pilus assembly protein Flp/PilA